MRQMSPIEEYLRRIQDTRGYIKPLFSGDSTVFGANYKQGLRLPWIVGLAQLGFVAKPVGGVTPDDGEAQFLVDCFSGGKLCQAIGNITTRELLTGVTASSPVGDIGQAFARTVTPLSSALVTNNPDIVVNSSGINDLSSGDVQVNKRFINTVRDFSQDLPLVWYGPYDGCTVTNEFPTVNATFNTKKAKIRQAFEEVPSKTMLYVDSDAALSMFSRYPSTDVTAASLRSNGFFQDGVHLEPEGEAMRAAYGLGSIFGISPVEMMEMICNASPYNRVPWEYSGTVSGASVTLASSLKRKAVMTGLIIHNTGGGTGVYTLARRRFAQNGSTVISTTTSMAWTIPTATPPIGLAWPSFGNTAKDGGLCAWYNESWYFTAATSACEVKATGHYVTN